MKKTLEQRFWAKVQKTEGCWNWVGAAQPRGYGSIFTGETAEQAHRVSYKIHFGEIANGLYVLHACDNKRCVRPDHLHLGTQKENMQEALARGLIKSAARPSLNTHLQREIERGAK